MVALPWGALRQNFDKASMQFDWAWGNVYFPSHVFMAKYKEGVPRLITRPNRAMRLGREAFKASQRRPGVTYNCYFSVHSVFSLAHFQIGGDRHQSCNRETAPWLGDRDV